MALLVWVGVPACELLDDCVTEAVRVDDPVREALAVLERLPVPLADTVPDNVCV